MKQSILALAICACGYAQAQSNVVIYGVIDTGVTYTSKVGPNNQGRFSIDSGDVSTSRIGFKGTEDLGGGLKAIFQLENGFNADDGTLSTSATLFDRKAVVGLSGAAGTVTIGRQTDYLEDIGGMYTSVSTFGGNGVKGGHFNNLDRVSGARTNNSIRYDSKNTGGFTGNLFYGFGEVSGQFSAGQAFGFGANYARGPFGLGFAYYQSKQGANTAFATAGTTDLKTFTLGSSYTLGPAKIYGAWSQVKRPLAAPITTGGLVNITTAAKANIFDIGVDYTLASNLHLLASVIHDRADLPRQNEAKGKTTQWNLGVDYFLSKRTDVYAMYSNQSAQNVNNPGVVNGAYSNAPADDSSQNVWRVGVRHKF